MGPLLAPFVNSIASLAGIPAPFNAADLGVARNPFYIILRALLCRSLTLAMVWPLVAAEDAGCHHHEKAAATFDYDGRCCRHRAGDHRQGLAKVARSRQSDDRGR